MAAPAAVGSLPAAASYPAAAMQTKTFPCPFCGRKMGVGANLLGHRVRCPHCKQVVLAPTEVSDAPAAPTLPPPVPASPPPPPADLPVFNITRKEAADSIMGEAEESDDEVFSSNPGGKVPTLKKEEWMPAAAPSPPPPAPRPVPANPFDQLEAPVPPLEPAPAPEPQMPPNPWGNFAATPVAPTPGVVAYPAPPADEPELVPTIEEADEPADDRRRDRSRKKGREKDRSPYDDATRERTKLDPAPKAAGGGLLFKIGFFLLVPYALLMTGLAVYGLFIKSGGDKTDTGHPLSTIPDNFGEFPPAERKKISKAVFPGDGDLPTELRVGLGKTLAVGQIEVEPLKVEARRLTIAGDLARGGQRETFAPTGDPALVLHLRVKNTSDDLTIYPLDPAFNRKNQPGQPHPATGLVVNGQAFWGGQVEWPFPTNRGVKRMFELAQEDDYTPLKPKESREYVVTTAANRKIVAAVEEAGGPVLWRVQVRRGLVPYRGKEVPVTAVVGVEFRPADVKGG